MPQDQKQRRPLSGVLYVNDRKQHDRQADYTGSCTTEDGKEYRLDAWVKEMPGKPDMISIALKPKNQAPAQQEAIPQPTTRPLTITRPARPPQSRKEEHSGPDKKW